MDKMWMQRYSTIYLYNIKFQLEGACSSIFFIKFFVSKPNPSEKLNQFLLTCMNQFLLTLLHI